MRVLRSLAFIGLLLLSPSGAYAQTVDYVRGHVLEVIEERGEDLGIGTSESTLQKLKVKLRGGDKAGEEVTIDYGSLTEAQKIQVGQQVIVGVPPNVDPYIFDRYRLSSLGMIATLFAVLAVVFAGWRGLTSLAGLGVSVLVLALYVVPQIMAGKSPLLISFIGAVVIAFISIYLAHGFNRRTTVAVASTLITVVISIGLAHFFVGWADLLGIGSDEAFQLQSSPASFLNLRGLLLGGIIIGALGVLDDITTSQAAAVEEISKANPALTRRELYKRGASVGKEHITSLINTLALAYVGASFPALLLFTIYRRPWWVVVNTEPVAEEIIRTLVGSVSLMVAVPITTAIAAYWLSSNQNEKKEGS